MSRFALMICALGALALAGCTQQVSEMSYPQLKDYVAKNVDKCRALGIPEAEMQACVNQEINSDQARRLKQRQFGAALGQASRAYGQSLQTPAYQAPVTCRSTPFRSNLGGPVSSVTTTCQ